MINEKELSLPDETKSLNQLEDLIAFSYEFKIQFYEVYEEGRNINYFLFNK
jgi:hypothetical protein